MNDDTPQAPMDELLGLLDLERLGKASIRIESEAEGVTDTVGDSQAELFLGVSERQPHGRIFGGQVLAQSLMAAGLTVLDEHPDRLPHSLHAYFMRAGDDTQPIRFGVERMRDGRSFSTRRVHAIQNGVPILSLSASFQDVTDGLDHQVEMPEVPGPDGIPSLAEAVAGIPSKYAEKVARRPIEQRHVEGPLLFVVGEPGPAHQHVWMRTVGAMPNDDPLLAAAVLAYASDFSLLESTLRRHGRGWGDRSMRVASLDHTMWFHRPARPDQWLLYELSSPSAQGGRGLGLGRMFDESGILVASTAQEGMVRVPREG